MIQKYRESKTSLNATTAESALPPLLSHRSPINQVIKGEIEILGKSQAVFWLEDPRIAAKQTLPILPVFTEVSNCLMNPANRSSLSPTKQYQT